MTEKKERTTGQLHALTEKIERLSDGKQRVTGCLPASVCIEPSSDANVGMYIWKHTDFETGLCHLEFRGFIRRLGTHLTAAGMRRVAGEITQIADLLEELEQEPVIATAEEIERWAREIGNRKPTTELT